MEKVSAMISCWLLIVGVVTAQTAQTPISERLLPQWLTGIIAVTSFLFLTFVGFLVKKAWCEESSRSRGDKTEDSGTNNDFAMSNGNTYEICLDMVRSKDDDTYNVVIDSTDEKVTAM
ncbi:Proximal tubules-expressed gene protein [Channa argus]|uniref:Proximal tubules-expressed gene protein n=1 Tax=Channa argus TaxID=215402 RepID=A0A6G1PJT5_CHAAH|nr:Proximal tubules-expressed gene protein [Channa argus]